MIYVITGAAILMVGFVAGFFAASLLSIGHDADLIDRIQVQERHIRELARQLQDAQAVQL